MTQNNEAHTLAHLYSRGYKLKKFSGLNRAAGKGDPVGVALFEKRGDFFESVVYERFDGWLYATPEKMARDERAPDAVYGEGLHENLVCVTAESLRQRALAEGSEVIL